LNSGTSIAAEFRHAGACTVTPVDDKARIPRRSGIGRQSKLGLYAPWVEQWLREDPDLSSAEILRRVRLAGYRGGKTALYEFARRLRLLVSE